MFVTKMFQMNIFPNQNGPKTNIYRRFQASLFQNKKYLVIAKNLPMKYFFK